MFGFLFIIQQLVLIILHFNYQILHLFNQNEMLNDSSTVELSINSLLNK
jgi:hypothetical protein